MRKIPTLFVRDFEGTLGPAGRFVLPILTPGCEWVLAGEGRATRKLDGTAVLVQDGHVHKRREVKPGRQPPPGFVEVDRDDATGKRYGWVLADPVDPADRWLMEAVEAEREVLANGTYELIGPKIQGNPENVREHRLVPHGDIAVVYVPTGYDELRAWLADYHGEGIVWHHPDGRMAKIKRRDFPEGPT